METKEQVRRYKNSVAESFASLSFGLWAVSIIGYISSGVYLAMYVLVIAGAISALFSIYLSVYLVLPWDWKQQLVLRFLETKKVMNATKLVIWLIILATFAVGIMQTEVVLLMFIGLIIVAIAFIVFFYVSIFRMEK